jgi:hypothetical protein
MSIRAEHVASSPSLTAPGAAAPGPGAAARATASGPGFGELFQSLAARVDNGEALVSRAVRGNGGELEPSQWIALQAGIYRYVEAVDLAGKLVDRAGTAVRTVLQAGN